MTLGDITTIPLTHEMFRESPEQILELKLMSQIKALEFLKFSAFTLSTSKIKSRPRDYNNTSHHEGSRKRGGQRHTQQPIPSTSKNTYTHTMKGCTSSTSAKRITLQGLLAPNI